MNESFVSVKWLTLRCSHEETRGEYGDGRRFQSDEITRWCWTHTYTHIHTHRQVWSKCGHTVTPLKHSTDCATLPSAVGSCLHHLNQTSVSIRHFSVTTEIMRKPNPTSMKTRQYPMCVNIVAPRYDITFEERQEKGEVGWSPTGSLGCLTVIKHSGKTV